MITFRPLGLLLMFLSSLVMAQGGDEELLRPEQAFRVSATEGANGPRLSWEIADGYYLYRSKFRFATSDEAVTVGPVHLPEGKIKHDEFFGDMAVFRKQVAADIPLEGTTESGTVEILATVQGCADLGVCYPPHTQRLTITLPEKPAVVQAAVDPLTALTQLSDSLGLGEEEEEFLDPEKAFVLSVAPGAPGTLVASWRIADGYYLYKHKFKFLLTAPEGASLGPVKLPDGKVKDDEFFGRVETFYHAVEVVIPLIGATGGVNLDIGYQGCADAGLCYPPITKSVSLNLDGDTGLSQPTAIRAAPSAAAADITDIAGTTDEAAELSQQDRIARSLTQDGWGLVMLTFFGFGLLLSFTPCVFPMIPILSSIIVGQGEGLTTRKAFVLSLVYVLAMASTYTVAGVLAGMFGENLQAMFQDPWILGSFAVVFVVLSLSMFGFYDLQVPTGLQSRLTALSNQQEGGTLMGVAMMGFLSALIVGPCVAAPLAGALIYIGQTGDMVLGGLALFALSMGMGAPLLALGTSAGKLLPRAGAWMDTVKSVFGVVLLGVAVWMLERVLPGWIILLMWSSLLIVPAIYMGAIEPVPTDATGWRRLWKGVGLLMLIYGVLLMIGAASGGSDPLRPLQGVAMASGTGGQSSHGLAFNPVKGSKGVDGAVQAAGGKVVMLDFYADWCVSCKELEKYTFSDPAVQAALSDAVLLQTDVTANDAEDQALMKAYGIFGPPAILFFDRNGTELPQYRLVGFMEAPEFLAHVRKVTGG